MIVKSNFDKSIDNPKLGYKTPPIIGRFIYLKLDKIFILICIIGFGKKDYIPYICTEN